MRPHDREFCSQIGRVFQVIFQQYKIIICPLVEKNIASFNTWPCPHPFRRGQLQRLPFGYQELVQVWGTSPVSLVPSGETSLLETFWPSLAAVPISFCTLKLLWALHLGDCFIFSSWWIWHLNWSLLSSSSSSFSSFFLINISSGDAWVA